MFGKEKNSSDKKNTFKSKLHFEYKFSKEVKINQILQLFQTVANQLNFSMVESQFTHAIAVHSHQHNIIQILDCFRLFTQPEITSIKMTINLKETTLEKVCEINCLTGSKSKFMQFLKAFNQIQQNLTHAEETFLLDTDIQIINQKVNPYYYQSCALYVFHKILSNKNYQLTSQIQLFSSNFENSLTMMGIKQSIKNAITLIERVIVDIDKKFDLNQKEIKQIMPYSRICVEKYVFQKLYPLLSQAYSTKNQKQSMQFLRKQTIITKKMKIKTIFKNIGLRDHLWTLKQENPEQIEPSVLIHDQFEKSFQELKKMQLTHCPRQKLMHYQIMFTNLKISFFQGCGGKYELYNIQDIIPLLILILAFSGMRNIKDQLDFISDYLENVGTSFETQKQLISHLNKSYSFILTQWTLPQ